MAGSTGGPGSVVVWEWLNEFGRWTPYTPTVSGYIEAQSQSGVQQAGGGVNLGGADPSLACYMVDLQRMFQVRQGTGECATVWCPLPFTCNKNGKFLNTLEPPLWAVPIFKSRILNHRDYGLIYLQITLPNAMSYYDVIQKDKLASDVMLGCFIFQRNLTV